MFNVMVKWNHTETLHFFVLNGERGSVLCPCVLHFTVSVGLHSPTTVISY